MATIINADTSDGLKLTSDTSGEIQFQSGGTTKMTVSSSGVSGIPTYAGTKNLIINGNMQIAQRGTSVSGITGNGLDTVDRFTRELSAAGTWTMSQDTDVPSGQGFASSMKYLCTTANASLGSGSYFAIESRNEGQNFQQLKYGSANAESVTLSFWVKSNKVGTYSIEFYRVDASRSQTQEYTIDSADTWEKKTVTIIGDTVGAIDNDNGDGYRILWWMGAGTNFTSGTLATSWATISSSNRVSSSNVNLADSTSNYINITGVQLEVGTTATDFEHLQYGQQLAMCQRYYYKEQATASGQYIAPNAYAINTTQAFTFTTFPVPMRINPTALEQSGTATDYAVVRCGVGTFATCNTVPIFESATLTVGLSRFEVASGLSNGTAGSGRSINTNAYLAWSAEL